MMGFVLHVPPAQTMCDGDPIGAWFSDLLVHGGQLDVENVFGDFLVSLLQYRSTGLVADPALSQIVHQHDNGYEAIYDLVHVGHPSLQADPSLPTEPHQHHDCKLATTVWAGTSTPCTGPYMWNICQLNTSCNSFCPIYIGPYGLMSLGGLHKPLPTCTFMALCHTLSVLITCSQRCLHMFDTWARSIWPWTPLGNHHI